MSNLHACVQSHAVTGHKSQFAATAVIHVEGGVHAFDRSTMKRGFDDSAYSAEPDLQVLIAECVVEVHSQVLMIASPVWRNMLTNDMLEGVNQWYCQVDGQGS